MSKNYKDYDESDGVWRTVGGRRIFIKKGQDLASAMIESGKFKNLRSDYRKAKEEEIKLTDKQKEASDRLNERAKKDAEDDIKTYLNGNKGDWEEDGDFIRDLANEYNLELDEAKKMFNDEYQKNKEEKYNERITKQVNDEYNELSKKMQQDDYYYKPEDDRKLKELRAEYDTLVAKGEKDVNLENYNKKEEESERLNIAKDIAKELNPSLKNASEERLEKEAKELLSHPDGYVLDKGETTFTNSNGELERSTESLKKWRDDLKKTSESSNKDDVVKLPDGTPIDQNYIKDIYSGMSYDEVKRENDFDKEWIKNVKPEARPTQEAKIRETDKYLQNMERYESKIDDKEFGTKDWGDNVYPFSEGTAWKGTKSEQGLSTTEIAKAVTDKMKEAYPGIKISRKTSYYSGGSSADFSITESDKPLIRNINDFSQSELNRLYNKGYNSNYYKNVDEFKEALNKRLTSGNIDVNKYHIDENYELTPYGKAVIKDLNKVINSYNYDESDSMTDYFHTGFYSDISIGKYNKPYQVNSSKSTNETMNNAIREKARTRTTYGRTEIKNASPSQIEKGDLIGPKKMLVTAVRPVSVEKDGYSSGYSVTTKDINGNTSRQIIRDGARNTLYKKSTNETMNNAIKDKIKLGGWKINEQGKKEYYERELGNNERGYWAKENGQRVFKENPNYDLLTKEGQTKYQIYYVAKSSGINADKDFIDYVYNKKLSGFSGENIKQAKAEYDKLSSNQKINNAIKEKAYQKYLKEHPGSKITFNEFKDMRK